MKMRSVAVLRGGPSNEYEVSLKTGAGVLQALQDSPFRAKDIVINKAGHWLIEGFKKEPLQALQDVDVVFLALHGAYGEDGKVQRLLEGLGIPYTGTRAFESGVAINKLMTKDQIVPLGIKTPRHMQVSRSGRPDPVGTATAIAELFTSERYVIKPVSGGSSLDTAIVTGVSALAREIARLLEIYETIMVEECVTGKEATVGILENYRGERWYKMPVIEIVPPAEAGFFAAHVKYTGETEEIVPGRFTKAEREALHEAALKVHQHLKLRHYSRSDFIVTKDGPVFLEVNTLPGLTEQSLFPKAIDAVGGTYQELVTHLINLAQT